MIAVVTVLLAFPLGFFVRSWQTANIAYAIAYLWAFSYQNLYLVRMWSGGDDSAFPEGADAIPIEYGLVTLTVFGAGFGLVALGHRVAARRRAAPATAWEES
jgi:hypothetical protein